MLKGALFLHGIRSVADLMALRLNYAIRPAILPVTPLSILPDRKRPQLRTLFGDGSTTFHVRSPGSLASFYPSRLPENLLPKNRPFPYLPMVGSDCSSWPPPTYIPQGSGILPDWRLALAPTKSATACRRFLNTPDRVSF